mgnify:CR=1 FL=1
MIIKEINDSIVIRVVLTSLSFFFSQLCLFIFSLCFLISYLSLSNIQIALSWVKEDPFAVSIVFFHEVRKEGGTLLMFVWCLLSHNSYYG